MPEREAAELFGLSLSGHPNPKRLLTTDGMPPLLLQVVRGPHRRGGARPVSDPRDIVKHAGWLTAERPYGAADAAGRHHVRAHAASTSSRPSTSSSTWGRSTRRRTACCACSLELDGEEVVTAEAVIGYLHRGIEKLAEHRRYNAIGTLMDRGDYVSGIMNELAFALAAEKLAEIEVPRRANWLRSLFSELNRLASHLVWYGTIGLDTGAMGQFLYAVRDRENLLDILEDVTGQRMMFNYVRPGGVAERPHAERRGQDPALPLDVRQVPRRARGAARRQRDLPGAHARHRRDRPPRWRSRSGSPARTCGPPGVGFDVRRDRPYAAYDEMDFDIPTAEEGDCWARYLVRMAEMRQATRMVRQCIDGMPEGEHTAKVPKVLRPPAGEAYAAVESSRGELGVHLVSDGTEHPYRMHYRPPTLFALQAGEALLPCELLADAVVMLGSIDFVLGEIDR